MAKLFRPRAGRLNQRGLADSGLALDQQHPAMVPQQLPDRRQVVLALTQPAHHASVPPPPQFRPQPADVLNKMQDSQTRPERPRLIAESRHTATRKAGNLARCRSGNPPRPNPLPPRT